MWSPLTGSLLNPRSSGVPLWILRAIRIEPLSSNLRQLPTQLTTLTSGLILAHPRTRFLMVEDKYGVRLFVASRVIPCMGTVERSAGRAGGVLLLWAKRRWRLGLSYLADVSGLVGGLVLVLRLRIGLG